MIERTNMENTTPTQNIHDFFPTAFRGYNRDAVNNFIDETTKKLALSDHIEQAYHDMKAKNDKLTADMNGMRKKITQLEQETKDARQTKEQPLQALGRRAQEIMDMGKEEAERIVNAAREQSRGLITDANKEADAVRAKAQVDAERAVKAASEEAAKELKDAQADAERMLASARQTAHDMTSKAQAEAVQASRRRDAAKKEYQSLIGMLRDLRQHASEFLDSLDLRSDSNSTGPATR